MHEIRLPASQHRGAPSHSRDCPPMMWVLPPQRLHASFSTPESFGFERRSIARSLQGVPSSERLWHFSSPGMAALAGAPAARQPTLALQCGSAGRKSSLRCGEHKALCSRLVASFRQLLAPHSDVECLKSRLSRAPLQRHGKAVAVAAPPAGGREGVAASMMTWSCSASTQAGTWRHLRT